MAVEMIESEPPHLDEELWMAFYLFAINNLYSSPSCLFFVCSDFDFV